MQALEIVKNIKFDLKQVVEFAIISGKDTGIVTDVIITPDGLLYGVVWSNKSYQKHYDFELKNK